MSIPDVPKDVLPQWLIEQADEGMAILSEATNADCAWEFNDRQTNADVASALYTSLGNAKWGYA